MLRKEYSAREQGCSGHQGEKAWRGWQGAGAQGHSEGGRGEGKRARPESRQAGPRLLRPAEPLNKWLDASRPGSPCGRPISSAVTVQSRRVAINAPGPPSASGRVLCCKNTVGRLQHPANDSHHEAIKVMGLAGGGRRGRAGATGPQLPRRWRQELSEN